MRNDNAAMFSTFTHNSVPNLLLHTAIEWYTGKSENFPCRTEGSFCSSLFPEGIDLRFWAELSRPKSVPIDPVFVSCQGCCCEKGEKKRALPFFSRSINNVTEIQRKVQNVSCLERNREIKCKMQIFLWSSFVPIKTHPNRWPKKQILVCSHLYRMQA